MSCNHTPNPLTRRQALSMVGGGMGMVALSNMVSSSLQAATPDMVGTKGALPNYTSNRRPSASSSSS